MMRRMYHRCKLVHADLSEYNILYVILVFCTSSMFSGYFYLFAYFHSYHKNRMYFIDVSQSVEHDHPNSLQFLRKVSFEP